MQNKVVWLLVPVAIVLLGLYFANMSYTVAKPKLYSQESTYSYSAQPITADSFDPPYDQMNGPYCSYADFDGDGKMDYFCFRHMFGGSPSSAGYFDAQIIVDYSDGTQRKYTIHTYVHSYLRAYGSLDWTTADVDGDGKEELYFAVYGDIGSYSAVGLIKWTPSGGAVRLASYGSSSDSYDYVYFLGVKSMPATAQRDMVVFGYEYATSNYTDYYYCYYNGGTSLSCSYLYDTYPYERTFKAIGTGPDGSGAIIYYQNNNGSTYDGMRFNSTFCHKDTAPICAGGSFSGIAAGYYVWNDSGVYWQRTVVGSLPKSVSEAFNMFPFVFFLPDGAIYGGTYWKQDFVSPIPVDFVLDTYAGNRRAGYFVDSDGDGLREIHLCSSADGQVSCTVYGAPLAASGFDVNAPTPLDYDHGVSEVNITVHNYSLSFSDSAEYYWYVDGQLVSTDNLPEYNFTVSEPGTHTVTLIINVADQSYMAEADVNVPAVPWNVHIYKHVSAPYGEENTIREVNLCATAEDDTPDDLNYYWTVSMNLSAWQRTFEGNCISFQVDLNDFTDSTMLVTVVVEDPDGFTNSASGSFDVSVVDQSGGEGGSGTEGGTGSFAGGGSSATSGGSAPAGYVQVASPSAQNTEGPAVSPVVVVAVLAAIAVVAYLGVLRK